MTEDAFTKRAKDLSAKALAHGIELKQGEPFLDILEKLIKRLDMYRDKPDNKGKLIVE